MTAETRMLGGATGKVEPRILAIEDAALVAGPFTPDVLGVVGYPMPLAARRVG